MLGPMPGDPESVAAVWNGCPDYAKHEFSDWVPAEVPVGTTPRLERRCQKCDAVENRWT